MEELQARCGSSKVLSWLELGAWGDEDVAAIEPFDDIELRLGDLWPPRDG